jgi:hypothetical protein
MVAQDYTALTKAHEAVQAKGKAKRLHELTVQLTPEEEAERAKVGNIAYTDTFRAILLARGVPK